MTFSLPFSCDPRDELQPGMRIAAAAPDLATALGYDVAAALEELDQIV
jgi:hypothetical protein